MLKGANFLFGGGGTRPYDAEVEYLEGTGSQYIDTGIICDDSTGFSVDLMPYHSDRDNARVIGSYCGSNGRWGFIFRENNYIAFYYGWNSASTDLTDTSAVFNNRFTAKLNYLNDRKFRCGSVVRDLTETLYSPQIYSSILFGNNQNGTINKYECFIGRIYGCVMTRGTSNIRDYIPVRVGSVGYMYDRVSGQLFGNAGTGAFVVGPDKSAWTNPYVTDGAILHLDAEWNAGGGLHDDSSPTLVDLVGNYDTALTGNYTINSKSISFNGGYGVADKTDSSGWTGFSVCLRCALDGQPCTAGFGWSIYGIDRNPCALYENDQYGHGWGLRLYDGVMFAHYDASLHSYVFSCDLSNTKFFIDGVLIGEISGVTPMLGQSANHFRLMAYGSQGDGIQNIPTGTFYNVLMYNRAITDQEAAAYHTINVSRYGA